MNEYRKYNTHFLLGILCSIIAGGMSLYANIKGSNIPSSNVIEEKLSILDKISIPIQHVETDTLYDCIIYIRNQVEFDNLLFLISEKILTFNNILINIEAGKYFSKTDHISFENQNYKNCRISIVGNGDVTIMATSNNLLDTAEEYNGYKVIRQTDDIKVDPEIIFTDGEKPILLSILNKQTNSGVSFTEELFDKINPDNKKDLRYRLKSSLLPDLSANECRNLWLWATHCWTSSYEKIDSVSDGYIYITVNKDIELYQCSLNTDYKSCKVMPRVKVINYEPSNSGIYINNKNILYLPNDYDEIYKCDKGAFLNLYNSKIKSIELSGIKFVGGNSPILEINKVEDYVYVHDCEFVSQQKSAILLKTNNGIVCNNKFQNSMNNVIDLPNGFKNHIVYGNEFILCGHRLLNQTCIKTIADSVLIAKNTFHNNLIAAISLGLWYGQQPEKPIFTIVEDNVIYNDNSMLKDYLSNSLLDVSLLYCATKNDIAIIRRNRLHGLHTLAYGNGIYVDDGAYNVNVYDNIITGIEGNLYNINCRSQVSKKTMDMVPEYSTNNFIANNIVDGPIRYEIRVDLDSYTYPKSIYGGTIYLYTQESNSFKNKFENVETSFNERYEVKAIDLQINIPDKDYNILGNATRNRYKNFLKNWLIFTNKNNILE